MVGKRTEMVETAQGTKVQVQVIPQGKKFALVGFDEWTGSLKIRLHEKPEKGKANQELKENLQKIFNAKVEIIAGEKQRQKMLLVHAGKKSVMKSLPSFKKEQT